MKLLNSLSIRSKITLIILLVTVISLSIAFIFIAFNEIQTYKKNMSDNISVMAKLVGENTAICLVFNTHADAKEQLSKLKKLNYVANAYIYDNHNKLFAKYDKSPNDTLLHNLPVNANSGFSGNYLHIYEAIEYKGEKNGIIYIRASTEQLTSQINEYLVTTISIMLALLLASYFLASKLQKIISVPLLKLAKVAQSISEHADYTIRVQRESNDEIGALQEGFNSMLDKIQSKEEERNKVELALRESEKYNRTLFEQTPIGLIVTKIDGSFIDMNTTFCDITGYFIFELLKFDNWKSIFVPEQIEEINSYIKKEIDEKGFYNRFETQILNKEGRLIPARLSGTTINQRSERLMLSIVEDITEHKIAEDNKNLLLSISQAANFSESLDDLYRLVHLSVSSVMNADNFYISIYDETTQELTFPYIIDEIDPDNEPIKFGKGLTSYVIKKGQAVLLSAQDIDDLNIKGEAELVGLKPFQWMGIPLKLKDKTIGVMVIQNYKEKNAYSDDNKQMLELISDQIARFIEKKRIELELIIAKETAEKSNRLKSDFLAQMSHEIRTPINSILSFTSLLREELESRVSDDLRESFRIINNGGKRLIRTIDSILNMSQIQTGNYDVNLVQTDIVNDILEKIIPEFKHTANDKKLELVFTNHAKKTVVVADTYTTSQIFQNLIDNAIKYTPKGKVEIIAANIENRLNIEIIDSGIGISKEYLPQIFSPFSQEDTGYTRKFEGNGLGLALVKKYIELNNAFIKVDSEKNKGTKFTVVYKCN